MARVFVTRKLPGDALATLRDAGHEVDVWEGDLPPEPAELHERCAGADALLCLLTDRVGADLLDAAPSIRAIANLAVGTDNIDLEECERRGIPVGNTPGVLTEASADLAFALILAAARRVVEGADAVRNGEWRTWEPAGWLGADVHGATLGIIGPGKIGRAVAARAAGFDMEVILAGRGTPLDTLLTESDFISLHCPLTDQTRGLIGAAELAAMKPTAILINTARGEIVDQDALLAALESGSIGGAGLDVTTPEPLPPDHPLLGAPNLTVVPHIGSGSRSAREAMARLAAENLIAALGGERMPNPAG